MHLKSYFTLPLLLLAPFLNAQVADKSQKIDPEQDWSGTATYISRSGSKSSSRSKFLTMESRSSHVYRMDASISRGTGTGSSSSVVDEYSKYTETMGGRTSVTVTEVDGTATGSMATEIIVEMVGDDQYSFFIPIPHCKGKKTKRINGVATVSEMGEDEAMIQVEFQPLGKNPNVISGEIRDSVKRDNGDYSETILRWSFVRGPLDVELIVSPENYMKWLPVPGKDEKSPGAKMNIGLKLQGKGGKEPRLKAKSFELRLVNTSKEPGVAINYPVTVAGNQPPDIQFLSPSATSNGQELILPGGNGLSASAQLAAFDGGGHTTLQVEAILEGGIRIQGKLESPTGVTDILIPKRKVGARIADAWLESNGNPAEQSDEDKSPGNNNHGDGLTAYEEYRGVFSEGKYLRLSPDKKELGVQVKKESVNDFKGGLGLFTTASGVKTILLHEDELGDARVWNNNRQSATLGEQHALRLEDTRLADGVVGRNEPESENGKTPKESQRTVIDLQQIKKYYAEQAAAVTAGKGKMPYTLADEIDNTVAHELAHGVNVTHHGPNSAVIPRTAIRNNRPPFALYASDGSPKEIPEAGLPMKLVGDNKGNESSGDLGCIIAYTARYQWYFEQASDRTLVYRAVPLLPQGKHFCTSGKGTGINAKGFFGDSRKGNCLGQIRVKDR